MTCAKSVLPTFMPGSSTKMGAGVRATQESEQVSFSRLILQEVGVRHFKSTAHKIDGKASWTLGFSDMASDSTGQQ